MMESYPLDMQGLPVSPYRRADGETVVVLYADMAYYTSKGCIAVPKGFESAAWNSRRFFWRLFGHPFQMEYLREVILHDWLYKEQTFDRKTADLIFMEEMEKSAQYIAETENMNEDLVTALSNARIAWVRDKVAPDWAALLDLVA